MLIIQEKVLDGSAATLVGYVQQPSEEMPDVARKPAVLVCPGGAYLFTSEREAEPIALSYAARGFQAFVLWYSTGKAANGRMPLREASAAIALMRKNAEIWHLLPDQIATVGFSAGGHLAAWVGLCGEERPNAMVLCYPGLELSGRPGPLVDALLGGDAREEDARALDLYRHVRRDSIPMFCWNTADDALIPSPSVLRFALAYAENGAPYELHTFLSGEHGMALATPVTANGRRSMVDDAAARWLDMSVDWLWRCFGAPPVADKPYEPLGRAKEAFRRA